MGEIAFNSDSENWVMKINDKGIFFNRERYPHSSHEDFAQAVIQILENEFEVEFKRKSPPYNKSN